MHSSQRQKKEDAILERHRSSYEEALIKLHAGLSLPRRMKLYEKVQRKIGELQEKHQLVAHQYQVSVTKDPKGLYATSVGFERWAMYHKKSRASGTSVLRTSLVDWSIKRVLLQYGQLHDMEQTFRSLKSTWGLRPLYHQNDVPMEAHLMISILAYYGVHTIRKKLRNGDIYSDWETIRGELNAWKRGSITLYQTKTKKHIYRLDAQPTVSQTEISELLDLPIKNHLKKCDKIVTYKAMSSLKKKRKN